MGEIKNEILVRNKTPNKINENEGIDEVRRKLQLNKTDKNRPCILKKASDVLSLSIRWRRKVL